MSGAPAGSGLGLTRWRDLAIVAVIAAVAVKLLLVWNYQRIPALPAAAGVPAALIGIGELAFGIGLRRRIAERAAERTGGTLDPAAVRRRPLEPLMVARVLAVAKATALAGAAVVGLFVGILVHVVPSAALVAAAGQDRTAAVIGVVCALVLTGGGLFLERSCRAPGEPVGDPHGRYSPET
ncbi:DUF3180 domain-containing protein [Nakamurella sp. A5-74]|uniref:DUF3180 domain-containing protein n=1 Tax=Nakamurella sp. A5-74 TaxID=3158264 RepID=A0AAU8DSB5_9ACTN